jgi:3-oxoacyl-[acyl-carrier protein] reductase
MLLLDQVAVVTGATRGIGRAIALLLARHGCDIALNYLSRREDANAVAAEIAALGRRSVAIQANVGKCLEADALIDKAVARFGHVDILVNNAGITSDNLLLTMASGAIEQVIATNLLGTMYCTRAAARHMLPRRRGRIINISSVAATQPGRGQSNYAAAKGGVEAFTRAMAVELAPKNILVNAIAPGVVCTEMSERVRKLGEQEIMARLLVKRYGEPGDVARAVLYLVDPESSYITGQILQVNGGLKLG